MLTKVLPEQVSAMWSFFAEGIGMSLPPIVANTAQGMSQVLRAVLAGDLQVWFYDDDGNANFIMSTTIWTDPVTENRALLIYSFTAVYRVTPRIWKDTIKTLKGYAKAKDCKSIVAFVANKKVKKFLEKQGAKTDFNLIELEV